VHSAFKYASAAQTLPDGKVHAPCSLSAPLFAVISYRPPVIAQ
jgi:hypothetical protein